jgi:hypothetical protein
MRTAFTLTAWLGPLISDLTVWTKHIDPAAVTVVIAFRLLGAQFVSNIQAKFMHNPNHIQEYRKNNSINSHKQDTTALCSNAL